eukprot:TRINITY_DN6549_c0_g1_i1.p1 TRINITY_DN6549_c0_g1~~TRINITY_DN6549_c0_g1_i1.p1  ORF type:complete len:122 (+),score=20.66 TRINITY_DN6549_c0_g1_i1:40-366(+)
MHDETLNNIPKIFSFGFHNFELSAVSDTPKLTLQRMTINMLWHANKHSNNIHNTWSPLVCPWNCQIHMRQSDNPETDIIIKGKEHWMYLYLILSSELFSKKYKQSRIK